MTELPFSQACENNKDPILEVLRRVFTEPATILEIGTGTGQHAEHFARALPHLNWQPSDRPDQLQHCKRRLEQAGLSNVADPVNLDVLDDPWKVPAFDGAFSANTLHIMSWQGVEALFNGLSALLPNRGWFCVYGPFNESGAFTSPSNKAFDAHLRDQDPEMGIRDIEALKSLGRQAGLSLVEQCPMPANNQILIWQRD